jgi:phosphatidylglycerophosphate synthase
MSVAKVVNPSDIDRPLAEVIEFPHLHVQAGRAMEIGADVLVGVRGIGAIALYRHIDQTPDYQSWKLASVFLGLALTDAVDGFLAKRGRAFQGKDESIRRPHKSWPDQISDKCLVDGITLAIANREERNGNILYGSLVKGAAIAYIARDSLTSVDRTVAEIQDIDTRAQKSGKMKTLKQFGVITIALSPLAKNPAVKAAVGAGFVYTAKESVSSGVDLHKNFSQCRAEKRAVGELPLQKWQARREEKRQRRAYFKAVAEDAMKRKGTGQPPRVIRP